MQEKHQNEQQVGEPLAVSREQSNVLLFVLFQNRHFIPISVVRKWKYNPI